MINNSVREYQLENLNVETKEHVHSVSELSIFIGKKLNLDDDRLYTLKEIALFHDIGKSKISLDIIEKKGSLTDKEFTEIKKHPEYGRDILLEFDFNESEANMIYQHHERCDGSGYPLGITDCDISLEAKIIAVCDVFDALLSDRVYKKAWNEKEVKEFFKSSKEEFCPRVINIVLNNFKEMIDIRNNIFL